MFKHAAAIALAWASAAIAAEPYGLGRTPTRAEMASISIPPSGRNLPEGRGTVAAGQAVYQSKCASCHGAKGEGAPGFPKLVGGVGSIGSAQPVGTIGSYWPYATTVWDYINRAMPYQDAGSLAPDEVYAVTAWLLHQNGIVDARAVLDKRSLPKVVMPNRDGFVDDSRPDVR